MPYARSLGFFGLGIVPLPGLAKDAMESLPGDIGKLKVGVAMEAGSNTNDGHIRLMRWLQVAQAMGNSGLYVIGTSGLNDSFPYSGSSLPLEKSILSPVVISKLVGWRHQVKRRFLRLSHWSPQGQLPHS